MAAVFQALPVCGNPQTWQATGAAGVPAAGFVVDTADRAEVLDFYNSVYLASAGASAEMNWTGSYNGSQLTVGSTSQAYREHIRRRVNFFRALCGVPADITFAAQSALNGATGPQVPAGTSKTTCCMEAAYMNAMEAMFSQDAFVLTHNPPTNYFNWTNRAWNGCAFSNLAVGFYGPDVVDVYMSDNDSVEDDLYDNSNVGHRRWLLYPRTQDMASGDVPYGIYTYGADVFPVLGANAMYVIGNLRPAGAPRFTAWPNAGYSPRALVPLRWSLSWPGANFGAAVVTMTGPGGVAVPLSVVSRSGDGIGESTIVWEPQGITTSGDADATYTVTVSGITGGGAPAQTSWQTTLFNQDLTNVPISITGPVTPPRAGARYRFNTVPGSRRYRTQASLRGAAADYPQGAEDSQAADVAARTTGTYQVRQGAAQTGSAPFTARSGAKAFHLCFPPDGADQVIEIDAEFAITAASRFDYFNCFRWLFSLNRLSLEMSTNGGATWREIDGRNGAYSFQNGGSITSDLWDKLPGSLAPAWLARGGSLAAHAGKVARFRFVLRANGFPFDGEDSRFGCYIDDFRLTAVQRLVPKGNVIETTEPTFVFSETTLAAPIAPNETYVIRTAPVVGGRRMELSEPFEATTTNLSGYEAWVVGFHPEVTQGPDGDDDGDGIANLVEYVLGSDPGIASSGRTSLPVPQLSGDALTVTFTPSAAVTGVVVGAQTSTDLVNWTDVPNVGNASQHVYTVPRAGSAQRWMRLRVVKP